MSNPTIDDALGKLKVQESRLLEQGKPDGSGAVDCNPQLASALTQLFVCQCILIGMREIVLAIDRGNQ